MWVLEITEGAAANCAARKQPVQIGTVSKQHKPKVLLLSGADRANAAFARSFLLSLTDLLTSGESDASLVLKSVSVHLIFDLNPAVKDAGCASSDSKVLEDDSFLQFLFKEKFTMVLNAGFQSEYVVGPSKAGMRNIREKKFIELYKQLRGEVTKCSSNDQSPTPISQNIASTINGTVALDIGFTCCARQDRVADVVKSHRIPLYQMFMSARQGIAGIVTSPSHQPLTSTIKVSATNSRRAMDTLTDKYDVYFLRVSVYHINSFFFLLSLVTVTDNDGQFWIALPRGEFAIELEASNYVSKTKVFNKNFCKNEMLNLNCCRW